MLSGGTAIGHAFSLAVGPLLTRLYGPSDFASLALFSSFLSVMGVMVALQYEISIVSGQDEKEAGYLTFVSLALALPTSLLAAFILWMLIRFSAIGYGVLPRYSPVLLAFAMCFLGMFAALRYWCLREGRFTQVSRGVIAQSAGRAICQAAFGAAGFSSSGLLLGETVGRGMGMSRMFRDAWPVLRGYAACFRWDECKRALWRNRKFPLYSLPSSFLDALCLSLSVPLLIRLYGTSFGGYYSLVWRAVSVPSVLITIAIADTFHSRIATYARVTPGKVMRQFTQTSLTLLLMGSVPAVILWFWGAPLFRLVFGAQWAVSGTIAAIVAPWYLSDFVVSPVSRVVLVLSGQHIKLIWDIMNLASLVAIFVLAQSRAWAPLQTVEVLTVVNTLLRFVYYALLVRIVVRFQANQIAQYQVA